MDESAWSVLKLEDVPIDVSVANYRGSWEVGVGSPYFLYSIRIANTASIQDVVNDLVRSSFGLPVLEELTFPIEGDFLYRRISKVKRAFTYFTLWTRNSKLLDFDEFPILPIIEDEKSRDMALRTVMVDALHRSSPQEWQFIPVPRRKDIYVPSASIKILESSSRSGAKEQSRLYYAKNERNSALISAGIITLSSDSLVGYTPMELDLGYQEIVLLTLMAKLLNENEDTQSADLNSLSFYEVPKYPTDYLPSIRAEHVIPKNLIYACIARLSRYSREN